MNRERITVAIKRVISFPITPFLAALFPFFYFCSVNLSQIKNADIIRSLAVIGIGSLLILFFCWLFVRNWHTAAVMSAVIVTMFFLYGHLYQWIRPSHIFIARHSILLPVFLILMILLPWLISRYGKDLSGEVIYGNILFFILALNSAIPVFRGLIHYAEINQRKSIQKKSAQVITQVTTPDVYLIIMDAYARSDILDEYYDFDNSAFVNKLDNLGFVTIPCSASNYSWTIQSISSMLNFEYHNDVSGDYQKSTLNYEQLRDLFVNSKMRSLLTERGYQMIAFDTGYPFSEIANADKYYRIKINQTVITHFENIFLKTTLLSSIDGIKSRLGLLDSNQKIDMDDFEGTPEYFYKVKMNGFDSLESSVKDTSPKFVFAHLLSPHAPYIQDENGKLIPEQKFSKKAYLQQLIYTNKRILTSVEKMISASKTPPLILLMSDHGIRADKKDSMKNFISVYAPRQIQDKLYDTITPVNVTRIVFDEVFGQTFPLVEDLSFFQEGDSYSTYELIPNSCQASTK